jgi:hypothetical protein
MVYVFANTRSRITTKEVRNKVAICKSDIIIHTGDTELFRDVCYRSLRLWNDACRPSKNGEVNCTGGYVFSEDVR